MNEVTLGDLGVGHVGRRVTVETADATITGQLRGIEVHTDWIKDVQLTQHPDDAEDVPWRQTATVTVGHWTATDLPLGAKVTLP